LKKLTETFFRHHVPAEQDSEYLPGNNNCGKETGRRTDHQRQRKTLNRPNTIGVKKKCR